MNKEEQIANNSKQGIIFVNTVNGKDVWKKTDDFQTVYYLDEGYEETFPIWCTLRDPELLQVLYNDIKVNNENI